MSYHWKPSTNRLVILIRHAVVSYIIPLSRLFIQWASWISREVWVCGSRSSAIVLSAFSICLCIHYKCSWPFLCLSAEFQDFKDVRVTGFPASLHHQVEPVHVPTRLGSLLTTSLVTIRMILIGVSVYLSTCFIVSVVRPWDSVLWCNMCVRAMPLIGWPNLSRALSRIAWLWPTSSPCPNNFPPLPICYLSYCSLTFKTNLITLQPAVLWKT
jgi:hypothetical protein